ncbi:protein of unknown function [Insolitispirillum peregrinum]|uniref:YjiS-like domain-containing protein n=1 Tax=Insolitispirillum peregrinum TaxID=80876 RepID=A0A1N7JM22_9PROT|nr:protein of unknown function [Insolitispirillum peregrinum]
MSAMDFSTKALTTNQACEVSNILGHPKRTRWSERLSRTMITLFDRLVDGLDHGREMRVLHAMDDHMLADIGIARCDIDSIKPRSKVEQG